MLDKPAQEAIGRRIRARRLQLGLSQAKLAAAVGVAQPSICDVENGGGFHSRYLPALVEALRTSPEWIMEGVQVHAEVEGLDPIMGRVRAAFTRIPAPLWEVAIGALEGMAARNAEQAPPAEGPPPGVGEPFRVKRRPRGQPHAGHQSHNLNPQPSLDFLTGT